MERYKISPAQIYFITCDNARNMVKMVDLFNENSENNDEPVNDTDEENISNLEDSSYFEIQHLLY